MNEWGFPRGPDRDLLLDQVLILESEAAKFMAEKRGDRPSDEGDDEKDDEKDEEKEK